MEDPDLVPEAPFLRRKRALFRKMKWPGVVLYALGTFRAFKDGQGVGAVHRWWHPVNWVFVLILLPFCAVAGEPIFSVVQFRLSKFWRERRDEVQWL